jgi:hypothetical protein
MGAASVMYWKIGRSYVLASENCAFDVVGAEFIRDIEPGEMVIIEGESLKSIKQSIISLTASVSLNTFTLPDPTALLMELLFINRVWKQEGFLPSSHL